MGQLVLFGVMKDMNKELLRLTTGTRYVYFTSLLTEDSSFYRDLGKNTQSALSNVKNSINNELSISDDSKVNTSLDFLKSAAAYERTKEIQFFTNFQSKFPDAMKILNLSINDPSQIDYIQFIANINTALKGTEAFKKQIIAEQKRLKRIKSFDNTGDYNALTHNRQNKKLLNEEVNNALEERLFFLKRGRNFGNSVFRDIFYNEANESDITRIIVEEFGSKLFVIKSGHLQVRRTNALIKVLADQAYKLLVAEYENLSSDQTTRTIQLRKIVLGEHFNQLMQNILDSPYLEEGLDDIADQYHLNWGTGDQKVQPAAIKNIKERLKVYYAKIQKVLPEEIDIDTILKQQGITNKDLAELYKSTLTVSAQAYYTGEDINLVDLLSNGIGSSLGGGANPTDDIEAGKLLCTYKTNINCSALERRLVSIGREAYKEINTLGSLDDFINNTELLRKAREQQEQELEAARPKIENTEEAAQYLLSHVNIHSTIKGYKSAGRNRFIHNQGFEGAAFGPNLIEQLNIINTMTDAGGISLIDVENLQFAMVNAGELMIGHTLKPQLEDYFSIFVGFLMFNDAQLMFEDVAKWIETGVVSSVNDIHLYELNGVTIPTSYLLQNTYEALAKINTDVKSTATRGTKATLNTYDKGPITGNWEETLAIANAKTKVVMHFLAGFLDILDQITSALPQ